MADKKIIIKISSTGEDVGVGEQQDTTTSGESSKAGKETPKKAGQSNVNGVIAGLLISEGKKVLNNAVSQYANLTGDTITGNMLQTSTKLLGYVTAIAATGWVGAVGVAIDISLQEFSRGVEIRKANNQIELLRQRVGYSTINGGRDTND